MIKTASLAFSLGMLATTAVAEIRAGTTALLEAMAVPELMDIMHDEGTRYGLSLEEQLFPGQGGAAWAAMVEQTYDTTVMYDTFATRFDQDMSAEAVRLSTDFFTSDRGQRIVELEISARRALLEDSVEDAAIEIYEQLRDAETDRFEQVTAFIEANDLIEQNVMGALNSNYAFYMGLMEGNTLPGRVSEADILAEVWSQEDEIRANTTEWAYSYLLMAYQPLSDEDLDIYTALADTPEGRALNSALFAAYDEVFVQISENLGRAAARFMAGQDI